ncbi:Prostaglandin E synthase 2 [Galdieria sulphuraria]|nr:Prostaglandin E synthase 2 [Galdieria sulphuraria]
MISYWNRKFSWHTVESLWKRVRDTKLSQKKYLFPSATRWLFGGAALWATSTILLTEARTEQRKTLQVETAEQVHWNDVSKQTRDTSLKDPCSPFSVELILYQYSPCPYCNKVRAVCDYYQIPFRCVEVNPLTKKELNFSTYKKVPVAIINGQQVNGSTDIVLTIQNSLQNTKNGRAISPLTLEQRKWLDWIDDYFIHLLPPNIYRTPKEAVRSFDYIVHHSKFSYWQQETTRWFGGLAMYMVAKRLKSKYNIQDERRSLYEAINLWCKEGIGDKTFCGGEQPALTDLVMFGVVRSLEYYDVFQDIQANTDMNSWYQKMQRLVGESSMIPLAE